MKSSLGAGAEPERRNVPSAEAEELHRAVLRELLDSGTPFLVAGGYAVIAYTGARRPTKDLDIFTTAGNFERVLSLFRRRGYRVTIEDERWIGKIHKGDDYADVIFDSSNGLVPVRDDWFAHARRTEVLGVMCPTISPTELIWSKAFVQNRDRYDGADIAHLILKQDDQINWSRLLARMNAHWEILLAHLLNFRWIYPSERNKVPYWILRELMARLERQMNDPAPRRKICRGQILSRVDYQNAPEWGFVAEENQGAPAGE